MIYVFTFVWTKCFSRADSQLYMTNGARFRIVNARFTQFVYRISIGMEDCCTINVLNST